jgi:adenosylcobinamide-GDP ribazoletransferase
MILDAWRLALGTLTAVPVSPPRTVDRRRAGTAMVLAPLATLPLGITVAIVALSGHWLHLPALVTAMLAIGAATLGNRALHLDGLSDVADGLAASYDPARSVRVMKSGTSGPAGVTATILVIGLQAAGLASLLGSLQWWRAAILAGIALCVSRATLAVCCVRGVPPSREDGLGHIFTQTVPKAVAAIVWLLAGAALAAAASWAGLAWWRGPLAAAITLVVVWAVIARAVRRFKGVTGDVFGACIELGSAAILVVLS